MYVKTEDIKGFQITNSMQLTIEIPYNFNEQLTRGPT